MFVNDDKKILAIVGGGSVSVSVVCQLVDEIIGAGGCDIGCVHIFEPCSRIGAGLAYQLDGPSNLLNTRAAAMSPIHSKPDHFIKWLRANEDKWEAFFPQVVISDEVFLPRGLFGLYLENIFQDAKQALHALGIPVHHVRSMVTGMVVMNSGYLLRTCDERFFADNVVLALGNLQSSDWKHLLLEPGFFTSPYPCSTLVKNVHDLQSVCVLGSGLSAIDAVVALADAGHQGKLIMASRGGRLPSVRGNQSARCSSRTFTRENIRALIKRSHYHLSLAQVYQLLVDEVFQLQGFKVDIDSILHKDAGPHHYLDIEVRDAKGQERVWQSVLYSLNESIDLIWHYLDDVDKARFEAEFKSQWLAYRVSFPMQNAIKLQTLIHNDQLAVFGGVRRTWRDRSSSQFATCINDPRRSFRATIYSDVLINSAVFTTDVTRCSSALVRQMLDSGLAAAHPFGGIDVNFHTNELRTCTGALLPGVYALGALTSGTHFWTNAMNVNARLASNIVRLLVQPARVESHGLLLLPNTASTQVSSKLTVQAARPDKGDQA